MFGCKKFKVRDYDSYQKKKNCTHTRSVHEIVKRLTLYGQLVS